MSASVTKSVIPPSEDQPVAIQEQRSRGQTLSRALQNKWLKFSLRLGGTILLFALLLKSVSWQETLQKIHNLDDGELVIAAMVGMVGIIISSYQWQVLLDAEKVKLDLRRLVNLYLIGIAFNHFLPTGMGGDVVKSYYVGQEGQNHAGSASAVVLSRVTGFFGMLLVSVPALLIWHTEFSIGLIIAYVAASVVMCGALLVALWSVIWLPKLYKGRWAEKRIFQSFIKIGTALWTSLKNPRAICGAILFGALFHISAILNDYAFGMVLKLQVPITFYLVAIPMVALIAFLPISINGFGLREVAIVSIFGIMHVSQASALLLALLIDIQMILFGALGGIIYLFMGNKKSEQKSFQAQQKQQKEYPERSYEMPHAIGEEKLIMNQ